VLDNEAIKKVKKDSEVHFRWGYLKTNYAH
jgi:hypothetical protein